MFQLSSPAGMLAENESPAGELQPSWSLTPLTGALSIRFRKVTKR
jgi:hypothetical protein